MSAYTVQRIPVDKAEAGMILADDIINDVGRILMVQDTALTERCLLRLKIYDIHNISIKQFSNIEYGRKQEVISSNDQPPLKKVIHNVQDFEAFQESYTERIEVVQKQLLDIGEGKAVNLKALFTVSKDMLDTLQTKADLFSFLSHIKTTDDYTYTHSVNVSLLCNVFGQWLGYKEQKLKDLTVAGLLHDIGKMQIDPKILNKPGKLTPEEFEEIEKHPTYGFRLLEKQDISYDIKMATLMHHEKSDGTGYPMGAKDHQINHFAKIIAIADIYDAMTSRRTYRDKICPFEVIRAFEQECYSKLDTKFLMTFLQNIAYNYIGSWVRLSSGEEAEVVFINQNALSRPIVKVDNSLVDLRQEREVDIERVL